MGRGAREHTEVGERKEKEKPLFFSSSASFLFVVCIPPYRLRPLFFQFLSSPPLLIVFPLALTSGVGRRASHHPFLPRTGLGQTHAPWLRATLPRPTDCNVVGFMKIRLGEAGVGERKEGGGGVRKGEALSNHLSTHAFCPLTTPTQNTVPMQV